jgi:methyl-accepting chemotaxis protein
MTHRARREQREGENIRESTHAVSGNVDSFENHVESLQLESQSIGDVVVVVHEGGGSC